MPQLIPIALTFLVTQSLASTAAVAALSLLSYLLGESSSSSSTASSGHLVNTRSSESVLPVIYGSCRVGGNVVYASTTGDDNEVLHYVLTLCEGEIDGVDQVYLDGAAIEDYGDEAYFELFTGTETQAVCATLAAADANWDDPMRGTAYLYLRLTFRAEEFASGVPEVTATVRGRKVYDPRTSVTALSNNPALCWYDFVRNTRFGGGIASAWFDEQSIRDAATWCEAEAFTANGVIASQAKLLDTVYQLLACFRATIVWTGGTFRLLPLDADASVMSITADMIVSGTVAVETPPFSDLPNTIVATYISAEDDYVSKSLTVYDASAVASDNEYRTADLVLPLVDNQEQATYMAAYVLERTRLGSTYSMVCSSAALALEPGDIVEVTYALLGWSAQRCRIMSMSLSPEGDAAFTLMQEDADLYNATVDVSTHGGASSNLPSAYMPPPEPSNVTFSESLYYAGNVGYTQLNVGIDITTSPYLSYVEVWMQIDATGWVHYANVSGDFTVSPVREGSTYYFRFVSVARSGAKIAFADATTYSHVIIGANEPPADVTGFVAVPQSDTVVLLWDAVADKDLLGYVIKQGTSWASGVLIAYTQGETLQLNGVAPGEHVYLIKAVDTVGNSSETVAIASCTVYGPASYTELSSNYSDYNEAGETHTDTERYDDATYGIVLRVTRGAGGNLTGTYTSPTYDRGSVTTRRCWPVFDVVYQGTGVAWADHFIATTLWTDVFGASDTWLDLFGAYQAGIVSMRLGYSDDDSTYQWVDYFESYVAEVSARYVKYEITITDVQADGRILVKPCTLKEAYYVA